MPDHREHIFKYYEELIKVTTAKISALKVKIDRFSIIRVALLVVEIALFVAVVSSESNAAIILVGILMLLPIVVFVVVVKKQTLLTNDQTYLKNLLWVYQNEHDVISGLENGYHNGSDFENENHPYLSDLDIFGKASLFSLINRASTNKGIETLAGQLALPNLKHSMLQRQKAVKEIHDVIDDTFGFRAILKGNDINTIESLKNQLKNGLAKQLSFTAKSWLQLYVKSLTFLTPAILILAIILGGKLWSVFTVLLLVNAGITFFYMKNINVVYYGFGGSSALLAAYADAIKWTENIPWKSEYVKQFFTSGDKVSLEIKKLAKIIQAFDARLNILVGSFLNFCFLWDLKCCIRLGNWHQSSSMHVEKGLDSIGYFEELISIATLNYNNPEWVFPVIEDEFAIATKQIGHPLIVVQKRVNNDFELATKPTVDIVTGSNMAGKSTFLRTLGINMILAYAGAPVCASEMRLSIFKVITYMRIKDSLNESTSTFKAELNRLKMILENVEAQPNSLVLIDEMLRGTNSHDKYLGSKVFIEKMIKLGTPTLFATHDLQLSELKNDHFETVRNYHFDIQIENGEMNFDYKLKQGPCTIFNAAILLKEIGLSLEN